jgi:DNA polymerase
MSQTPDDPRALARDFATALEHLRTTWEVQYVPAGALPLASPPARAGAATSKPAAPSPDAKKALRQQAETWSAATKLEYLKRKNIGDCRRCGLCQTRTNIVFGVGNPEAEVMFIGEAPGGDEDRQGEPFVGRAGKKLDEWIRELGLEREDVYIANVLKCRPPGNRDPKPDEVDRCSPFLKAQIRAISPRVIVALGRHAGMLLSKRDDLSLGQLRRTRLSYDASGKNDPGGSRSIPLVVTYHPAFILRKEGNPAEAAQWMDKVMVDLRRAMQVAAPQE